MFGIIDYCLTVVKLRGVQLLETEQISLKAPMFRKKLNDVVVDNAVCFHYQGVLDCSYWLWVTDIRSCSFFCFGPPMFGINLVNEETIFMASAAAHYK